MSMRISLKDFETSRRGQQLATARLFCEQDRTRQMKYVNNTGEVQVIDESGSILYTTDPWDDLLIQESRPRIPDYTRDQLILPSLKFNLFERIVETFRDALVSFKEIKKTT